MPSKPIRVKDSTGENLNLELEYGDVTGNPLENLVGSVISTLVKESLLDKAILLHLENKIFPICKTSRNIITRLCNLLDIEVSDKTEFVEESCEMIFFGAEKEEFLERTRTTKPAFEPQYRDLAANFLLVLNRIHKLIIHPHLLDASEEIYRKIYDEILSGRVAIKIAGTTNIVSDAVAINNIVVDVIKEYAYSEIKDKCHLLREWVLEQDSEYARAEEKGRAEMREAQLMAEMEERESEIRVKFEEMERISKEKMAVMEARLKAVVDIREAQLEIQRQEIIALSAENLSFRGARIGHHKASIELQNNVVTVDIAPHPSVTVVSCLPAVSNAAAVARD